MLLNQSDVMIVNIAFVYLNVIKSESDVMIVNITFVYY